MEMPQLIYIGLMCMSLGINLVQHGKPREGKNNFYTALVGVAIQLVILYCGGFFR